MKLFYHAVLQVILLLNFYALTFSTPRSGFYLPDSVKEVTLRYRTIKNLIILPVVINDSIHVNLILDTGCRNLVLFGKRFQKLFNLNRDRRVQFSGLGSRGPVYGHLSLRNKVAIKQVLGEEIPVVVVPNKNIMGVYNDIHGVIGYDIFLKFEIELNPQVMTITFRPAGTAFAPDNYTQIPMRIIDSRPIIDSEILLGNDMNRKCDLMIDTGSALGLLLKTTNIKEFGEEMVGQVLGLGFNGPISGYQVTSKKLNLDGLQMEDLPTGIIQSPWHNYASIGMDILKNYVLVLNYCKAYMCLKKITV